MSPDNPITSVPARSAPPPPDPLPPDLPQPNDDWAALHLFGMRMPRVKLESSDGRLVRMDQLARGRSIVFVYPLTGDPTIAAPQGWDAVPGARGCSQEACGFRDLHQDLLAAGAEAVVALSTESPRLQRELVERLHLPYTLVSDAQATLAETLGLPTFQAAEMPGDYGRLLYRRLTLMMNGPQIEHVFYPVFPPDAHAREVLRWLSSHA